MATVTFLPTARSITPGLWYFCTAGETNPVSLVDDIMVKGHSDIFVNSAVSTLPNTLSALALSSKWSIDFTYSANERIRISDLVPTMIQI